MQWRVHDLFSRLAPGELAGGVAVVIDVLRATTTIATALAHGAARVRPVVSVAEGRAAAAAEGDLLGGERGGLRITGFDLGNSPREYTAGVVAGRSVVITTTNGTAAIEACRGAVEVLTGAVVNRSAVARVARELARLHECPVIHLVCAGTDGAITEEDVLAAGAILDAAARHPAAGDDLLDGPAHDARDAFRAVVATSPADPVAAIVGALAASRGGMHLLAVGMEADLAVCGRIDTLTVVPRLDRLSGSLIGAWESAACPTSAGQPSGCDGG